MASAVFAALTATFAKVGIHGVDSKLVMLVDDAQSCRSRLSAPGRMLPLKSAFVHF